MIGTKKEITSCRGWGWASGLTTKGHKGSSGGNGNVLCLDSGGSYVTVCVG